VDGEMWYLVVNCDIVIFMGIVRECVVLVEDGVVVDLVDGVVEVVGVVFCGYVYVDGLSVGEIIDVDLKDCCIFGEEGFILIVVVVDFEIGKIVVGLEIYVCGFVEGDVVFEGILL